MIDLAFVDIAFTAEFSRLDSTHEGRCELARDADRLGRAIASAARVMATDTIVVDDLVQLTIAPEGQHGRREPLTPFFDDEAERIINGCVKEACSQLPPRVPGIVLVETDRSWANVHDLQAMTKAWLEDPIGSQYPHVAGVLFTHRQWWTPSPGVVFVPSWRKSAPRWFVQSPRLCKLLRGASLTEDYSSYWERHLREQS